MILPTSSSYGTCNYGSLCKYMFPSQGSALTAPLLQHSFFPRAAQLRRSCTSGHAWQCDMRCRRWLNVRSHLYGEDPTSDVVKWKCRCEYFQWYELLRMPGKLILTWFPSVAGLLCRAHLVPFKRLLLRHSQLRPSSHWTLYFQLMAYLNHTGNCYRHPSTHSRKSVSNHLLIQVSQLDKKHRRLHGKIDACTSTSVSSARNETNCN